VPKPFGNNFVEYNWVIQANADVPPKAEAADVKTNNIDTGFKKAPIVDEMLPAR
jgi:hypothetical protein